MKRKNKLRLIQILCIISILITIFSIQRTYAKYFEKVPTTYQTNIKRWLINVNSHNVHEKSELSQVMQPILVEDKNVNDNILVPGREGYFEMLLDYSSVDLAFEYEFSIEQLNETPLPDFEIYGYEIVDGETHTVYKTSEIKGIIDPTSDEYNNSAGEKKREIRVLFRWNDGDGSTMDNIADTQFKGELLPTDGSGGDAGDGTDGGTGDGSGGGSGDGTGDGSGAETTKDLHTTLSYNAIMKFTQYVEPKS